MEIKVAIEINQSKEKVWAAITDIKNCQDVISSILAIEIIEQSDDTFVGLKWQETRMMFGKEATETMWITESVENDHYCTRAESHGSVYLSRLSLSQNDDKTVLSMSFTAEAQSVLVKIISACMGFFIKSSMERELLKDLADIKNFVEKN